MKLAWAKINLKTKCTKHNKSKIWKIGFCQNKYFCSLKTPFKKWNGQAINWEDIFTIYTSDKKFVFRMHWLLKFKNKKTNGSIKRNRQKLTVFHLSQQEINQPIIWILWVLLSEEVFFLFILVIFLQS